LFYVVQVTLDEAGAGPGCAVLNQEGDLIVGRDEAFYFTTLEGRGPCFACEGTLTPVVLTLLRPHQLLLWAETDSASTATSAHCHT